jgi:hypothetical protein
VYKRQSCISALHCFIPKLLLHFHLNSVILTSVSRGSFLAVRQFPPQSILSFHLPI